MDHIPSAIVCALYGTKRKVYVLFGKNGIFEKRKGLKGEDGSQGITLNDRSYKMVDDVKLDVLICKWNIVVPILKVSFLDLAHCLRSWHFCSGSIIYKMNGFSLYKENQDF